MHSLLMHDSSLIIVIPYLELLFISYVCLYLIITLFHYSFLCTLARSHLRPWVCLPRYRVRGYTLRGGRAVPRQFGWATVGRFVSWSSLLAFSMFHSCTVVFCSSYCIIMLMDSYVLCFWTVLCTLVTCNISYQQCTYLIKNLVQVCSRLNVYT